MRHRKCDTDKHRKLSKKQRRNRRDRLHKQENEAQREVKVTPPIDVSDIETVWEQRQPIPEPKIIVDSCEPDEVIKALHESGANVEVVDSPARRAFQKEGG